VRSSIAIDIPPTPVAGITGDLSICENDRTTLTASGGGTYRWSTGSGLAAISPNPSATTTYSVIVTNTFGCKDTAWATVTVNPNNLKLSTTVNNNNLQANASGGTAPYTYTLSPPAQPSNQDGSFPNLPNGIYTVFVSDATGCAILQPVSVQIVNDEEPLKIGGLSVFPNPSSGPFTISWNGPPSGFLITVYDIGGRLIHTHQGDSTMANLNLSGATPGVYAILLTTPAFSARGKVVIR
jgi:Secretion system C-terminal sorting domain